MLKFLSKLLSGSSTPVVRDRQPRVMPERSSTHLCPSPVRVESEASTATPNRLERPCEDLRDVVEPLPSLYPVRPSAKPFRRHMNGRKTWTGRRWSPLKIARNHRHETEIVFIIDGRLRRVPFEVTPHTSHLPYVVRESFYLVVSRGHLSEEEDLYARTIFPKCPYYRGYIIRENGQYVLHRA